MQSSSRGTRTISGSLIFPTTSTGKAIFCVSFVNLFVKKERERAAVLLLHLPIGILFSGGGFAICLACFYSTKGLYALVVFETKRKDFVELVLHHCVTILLMFFRFC